MYVIIWILSFLLLVIFHELWHFVFSKLFWVKIYEFWIWIPPKIKTLYKDKWWTEYTLNLFPLWWFVRPKWEDIKNIKDITDEDSFHSKHFLKKLVILLWGVFVNLLISFIIFTIAFLHWIKPIFIIPDSSNNFSAESYLFPTNSFAQKVWYISQNNNNEILKVNWIIKTNKTLTSQIPIKTWDIILSINWKLINTTNISKILKKNLWKKVNIKISRSWEYITYTWYCPSDWCLLWVFYNSNRKIQTVSMDIINAIKSAIYEIKAETILTFEWLELLYKKLIKWKTKDAVNSISWPVWAIAIWKYILQIWIWEYIAFIGSISLALAIFNVLPIPALDWWRIITTAIMHLFKINPTKYLLIENYITIVFFTLLMSLWVYIMYLDFIRFFW